MKKQDFYGVLKKATEIINRRMDIATTDKWAKGTCSEVALELTYRDAHIELLSYIGGQVEQIKTIEGLTQCLVHGAYAMGALGMRIDLLKKKLVGADKTGQEALLDAIRKDTGEDNPAINWLTEPDFESREVSNLVQEAFDNSSCISMYPDNADEKALAFIYLIDRLRDCGCQLDLTPAAQDFRYFSCLRVIINKHWSTRPFVGYFTEDGQYVMQGIDYMFIDIFAGRLRELLTQAGTKKAEHFKNLQIKTYLHQMLVQTYTGCSSATPLTVYAEIERLIAASESPKGITTEDYMDSEYSSNFAICRRYSVKGITYELSRDGLKTLATLLDEVLDLSGLQDVNVMVSKLKSVCA